MSAETIVIDIVANFRNQTSSGMDSARSSADRFSRSVQKARQEAQRLGSVHARPTVSLIDRASSTLSRVNSGINKLAGKTIRTGVRIVDYATRPLRAIKNTLFSIKGLVMAIGAGWAANKLISNPINLADSYSSAKIGFSTLLGDKKGQKMMDDLDKFAKETPFKTSNTISQAQKMIAMGWDAKNIVKDMTTIGDAAAATGKGDEGLNRIVLALAQIKSKGKLSTEELNQLAEAGISAKRYIAEGLGYGSGDSALKKMSDDLQKGAIGSEAAIKAIMQGMKEYKGMMNKTANETVEGLKSQIEDTFEINIFRRWGQGLQDGAKRGLGSIVKLLDKSEGSLKKFGDTVYDIGKQLSNWTADKLESTIDKILEVTNSQEFKNASLGGKIKIMWDEVVAKPFGEWWDSKGKPYMIKKMSSLGEGLGSGLTKGLLALFGINDAGVLGEATTIGGSFANGFAKGFEGKKVWSALIKAAGRAFKTGFSALFNSGWIGKLIAGKLALQFAAGILGGINKVQTFWSGTGATTALGTQTLAGMGMRGAIGATGNAMVSGSGMLGGLASLGYMATGGATTSAMSGGIAALAGAGTAAGIIGGVAGLGNSVNDLSKTIKANTKNDKKLYGTRAATKAGMVALGAGVGTLIAPGIGTAIGAGLGGIATFLAGNKLADSISGVSKSTAELNAEADKLAKKRMDKRFGTITLSAEQLAKRVKKVFGADNIQRVNKFNTALNDLETVKEATNDYRDDIAYTHTRIMAKEKLSKNDISDYQTSLTGYADSVSQLLSANKKSSRSAFQLLFGDDTKGMQKATKNMNSTYTKLENKLAKKSAKLNDVIAKAFEDGKITFDENKKISELVGKIEKIQDQVEQRIREKEQAENNAGFDLIGMKYKDSNLKADSFKDLVNELDKQSETSLKAYDDAYTQAKAEYDIELKTNPKYTKEQHDRDVAAIEKKWREGKTLVLEKEIEVTFDVVNEKYGKNFDKYEKFKKGYLENGLPQIQTLKESTNSYRDGLTFTSWDKNNTKDLKGIKNDFLKNAGIDKAMQKEMKTLYESLKPQEEDLLELKKSYEDAGAEIPQWIEDSLADIENIKLYSGDNDSFYKMFGEQIAKQDKTYAEQLLSNAGSDLPKAFKEGIEKGLKGEVETVDVDTNLKLKANKKDIDTSNLDKTTKDVVEKMKDKGIIYTKEGKVKVKTKDGKVDTSGLDKETKKAIKKLEDEGVIKINKKGEITVTAKSVDTSSAESSANNKTKSKVGKDTHVDKGANVAVKEKSTDTSDAKSKSDQKTKDALKGPVSVSSFVNVSIGLGSLTGLGGIVSSVVSKAKSALGNIDLNGGSKRQFASGGRLTRAEEIIAGEDGEEYIIPVSAKYRKRGLELWKQAGEAMGVKMYANGGVVGSGHSSIGRMMENISINSDRNTSNEQTTNRNGTVKVDVGGVNITIQSTGNGVQEDISQNSDAISGQIADILQRAFQNMPTALDT